MKFGKVQTIRFSTAFAFGLLISAPARCQIDITVQFLDAGSGKPLQGISVTVAAFSRHDNKAQQPYYEILRVDTQTQVVNTDEEGKAVFQVFNPVTQYLAISSLDLHGCSEQGFSLSEVLEWGVVAGFKVKNRQWCGKLKGQAIAQPGTIVIFDRRFTVWDRMLQAIP